MTYDPEARRDTPLALELKEEIRRHGPISVARYMQRCLHDPEQGYYVNQPAVGRAGDFITAPEISQVFGELIGLWAAVVWQQMGSPSAVNLVELGPGRGTLLRDALRAAGKVPTFFEAIHVHLVETSAPLMALQRARLEDMKRPLSWHASLEAVPAGPAILVANEFLDTFPVSQTIGGIERQIALDAAGRLVFAPPAGLLQERQDFAPLLKTLPAPAAGPPMAGLFIDYGHVASAPGETLQAVRAHRSEHPLTSPGEADLTVHVDFSRFADAAEKAGLAVDGPLSQAEFLGRLGIVERASRLMSANPAQAGEIEMAVARLIAPQGMGSRFKAIGLRSPALPMLPGLE